MIRLLAFVVLALVAVLMAKPSHAAEFDYAHTWGGAAPAQYLAAGRAALAAGQVTIIEAPLAQIEADQVCGRRHDANGWVQTACSVELRAPFSGTIIYVAAELSGIARRNVLDHELAHAGGWAGDHPGAMKPFDHLANCLTSGLSVRRVASLCNLDAGAPLRTVAERELWASMR